jgi:hypothetical protein
MHKNRRSIADSPKWPVVLILAVAGLFTPACPGQQTLPHLERRGGVTQLVVNGKPLLLLAGELHNSSPSSPAYMKPIWDDLKARHLNAVVGAASWELVEPVEGYYDYTAVDDQVRQAKAHGMKLVLIWFASFKNASYTYTPMWVKRDPNRFPLAQTQPKSDPAARLRYANTLSVFGDASMKADAHAFAALMAHLRAVDTAHTVVMIQIENETGLRNDSRDRSPLADAAYRAPVPPELLSWMQSHRDTMLPELHALWTANGEKTSGSWADLFGANPAGDEVFMAWFTARYLNTVAAAGKHELALPMYANAWLVQFDGQTPGDYPSGGPVSRMMDVWHLAAPSLSILAPDIYLGDFDGVCASYTREHSPLFIPEARASTANLLIAVAKYGAIGYSPFGIDGPAGDELLSSAYEALGGLEAPITAAQANGTIQLIPAASGGQVDLTLGGYTAHIERGIHGAPPRPKKPDTSPAITQDIPPAPGETVHKPATPTPPPATPAGNGYLRPFDDRRQGLGILVPDGPDSFYVIGSGLALTFSSNIPGTAARIGIADEGLFVDGHWTNGRRLNGDETGANYRILFDPDRVRAIHVMLYRTPQ